MPWYDRFSLVYDAAVERVYRPYRATVVAEAGLGPGGRALDLACGTGPNLPHLVAAVGPNGDVVATDFSAGMLARARRRVESAGWANVTLIERDARLLAPDEVGRLDAVVTTLGLSVIPDWEDVLAATWSLLAPGARYVVFDVHSETRVPATAWVEWIAEADTSRRPWEALSKLGAEVSWRYLDGSPHVHGGRPFVAVGRKPA